MSKKSKAKAKTKKKAKVFCPSCHNMAVPKVKGSLMWCGSCGDPLD